VASKPVNVYLDECTPVDSRLRYLTQDAVLPKAYAESYGDVLLSRPVIAGHGEITAFADDLRALFRILTSLPERCFDGDLNRYCAAIGLDDELAAVIRRGATGSPTLYTRADAFHDGESFKLLEFNIGSELGGVDAAQINRAFLAVDAFARFAEAHRLEYVDTLRLLVAELRAAARRVTATDPVVALIEAPGALQLHAGVFLAIQEAMRDHGIDLLLGEIQELDGAAGKITLHGQPLDVVLRYFSAGELVGDPAALDTLDLLVRADAEGRTALYSQLEGALFASKASLGLLHDPAVRKALTPRETAVVDRIVPHTLVIGAGTRRVADADLDAAREYALAHRESLVLKPGVAYSAEGVSIGHELSEQDWRRAVANARGRDYVAQQLVTPAPEPVLDPATGRIEDWNMNWGIFATEAGYSGAFVRALKPSDGSVITFANPGTRGACVFTCPEGSN
jgi:hypothetical protein